VGEDVSSVVTVFVVGRDVGEDVGPVVTVFVAGRDVGEDVGPVVIVTGSNDCVEILADV
jgi:hypothetical protein